MRPKELLQSGTLDAVEEDLWKVGAELAKIAGFSRKLAAWESDSFGIGQAAAFCGGWPTPSGIIIR